MFPNDLSKLRLLSRRNIIARMKHSRLLPRQYRCIACIYGDHGPGFQAADCRYNFVSWRPNYIYVVEEELIATIANVGNDRDAVLAG